MLKKISRINSSYLSFSVGLRFRNILTVASKQSVERWADVVGTSADVVVTENLNFDNLQKNHGCIIYIGDVFPDNASEAPWLECLPLNYSAIELVDALNRCTIFLKEFKTTTRKFKTPRHNFDFLSQARNLEASGKTVRYSLKKWVVLEDPFREARYIRAFALLVYGSVTIEDLTNHAQLRTDESFFLLRYLARRNLLVIKEKINIGPTHKPIGLIQFLKHSFRSLKKLSTRFPKSAE